MKADSQKVLTGLKKAKTSLEKIIDMVENDEYCIDIIQQNLAVLGLIKSANSKILKAHLKSCFKEASYEKDDEQIDEKIQELLKIIKLSQK